jgi:LmbE family N-acetylglucosaminyl deacetylase
VRANLTIRLLACAMLGGLLLAGSPTEGRERVELSIVAHEDDYALFMQPDILRHYDEGTRQVVLFLTAGSDGRWNDLVYARLREQGARDTYEQMAQIVAGHQGAQSGKAAWTFTIRRFHGRGVLVATSPEVPNVTLLFLRLIGSPFNGERWNRDFLNADVGEQLSLEDLWNGATPAVNTVDGSGTYTKDELLDLLEDVLAWVRPSLVRTQDPVRLPEDGAVDHPDHHFGALFAQTALRRYVARRPTDPVQHWAYRGYNIRDEVANLAPVDELAKRWIFFYYAYNDSHFDWFNSINNPGETPPGNSIGNAGLDAWLARQYPEQIPLP